MLKDLLAFSERVKPDNQWKLQNMLTSKIIVPKILIPTILNFFTIKV